MVLGIIGADVIDHELPLGQRAGGLEAQAA
jgi:hypothetical protein